MSKKMHCMITVLAAGFLLSCGVLAKEVDSYGPGPGKTSVVAPGETGVNMASTDNPASYEKEEYKSIQAVYNNDNENDNNSDNDGDKEENGVIKLGLGEARDRMVEESREAKRFKLGIEKLKLNKDTAEKQLEDLEDERDELDDEVKEMREEREELEKRQKEIEEEMPEDFDPGDYQFNYEDFEDLDPEEIEEWLEGGENNNNNDNNNDEEEIDPELVDEYMENYQRLMEIDAMLPELTRGRREIKDGIVDLEEGVRELEQQKELLDLELEQVRQQLKFSSEGVYVGLLSLDKQLETLKEGLDTVEKVLEEEKKKKEVGESIALAVEMVEMEKMQLENTYKTLDAARQDMEKNYLDMLGYPLDAELKLVDEVAFNLESFWGDFEFKEVLDKALENGHQMEVSRKKVEFAQDNLDWAKEKHYFSNEPDIKEIDLKEAKIDKEEKQKELEKALHAEKNAFKEVLRDYEIAQKELSIKKEMLRGEELQKELGMNTSRQVLEALTEKNQVERELLQVERDAYLIAQELKLLEEGVVVEFDTGDRESVNGAPDEREPGGMEGMEEREGEMPGPGDEMEGSPANQQSPGGF